MLRFCDLRLPYGRKTGIGGGDTQLAAVPLGQRTLRRIYASATASVAQEAS
jgi:hypothetical protein